MRMVSFFLHAHLHKPVDDTGIHELALEILQALVVVHVAARQDILQPRCIHAPDMSLHPIDGELAAAGLCLGLLVLGANDGDGRECPSGGW